MQHLSGGAASSFYGSIGDGRGGSALDCPIWLPELQSSQPQEHPKLKCPRCDSLNTKFCYYNNYNLSQPRHFCKSCRRYWTKGGVLRNVPVGGGSRKSTKRSSSSSATTTRPSTSPSPSAHLLQRQREVVNTTTTSSSDSSGLAPNDDREALLREGLLANSNAAAVVDLIEAYSYPDILHPAFADLLPFRQPQATAQQQNPMPQAMAGDGCAVVYGMARTGTGMLDQTAPVDLQLMEEGIGGLNCPGDLDVAAAAAAAETMRIYDQVGGVGGEEELLWSHGQWGEMDHILYFP